MTMQEKPTKEQIAALAYDIWQYTSGTRSAKDNWLEAEKLLTYRIVDPNDPDPIQTLIEAEWPI